MQLQACSLCMQVVISFRGTEQSQVADVLADMDIRMDEMDLKESDEVEKLNWLQRTWAEKKLALFKKSGPKVWPRSPP